MNLREVEKMKQKKIKREVKKKYLSLKKELKGKIDKEIISFDRKKQI